MCFLISCLFRKRSAHNRNYQRLWRPVVAGTVLLGGVGGRGGVPGGDRGGVKLPKFEDFAGEHSVKGAARRSEGGGV